jgi:hypothetical protein
VDTAGQLAKAPIAEADAGSKGRMTTLAVGLVVILCGLATGGILLLKKRNHRHAGSDHARTDRMPTPASTSSESATMPAKAAAPSGNVKPRIQSSLAGLKRNAELTPKAPNGTSHPHGVRRKKVFDYNRYFTDLMSAVSTSSHMEPPAANGNSTEVDATGQVSPEPTAAAPSKMHEANSEMIDHQKTLIEEQKRLIQEQTRLIEEKSKIIAEKNQLLKMQSEWIESKLL